MVNMLSSIPHEPTNQWILPAPSDIDTYREQMPLSPAELAYEVIQSTSKSSVTLVLANGTTAPPITLLLSIHSIKSYLWTKLLEISRV